MKDHPAIFVFDSAGQHVRSFGQQFQSGGHGLEIREESGEEFIYVTGYKSIKALAKLTLDGKQIWMLRAPMESKIYRDGEDETIRLHSSGIGSCRRTLRSYPKEVFC
jgi:hypothetical protein